MTLGLDDNRGGSLSVEPARGSSKRYSFYFWMPGTNHILPKSGYKRFHPLSLSFRNEKIPGAENESTFA